MNPLNSLKKNDNQENKIIQGQLKEDTENNKYSYIHNIKKQTEQNRNKNKKAKKVFENIIKNKDSKKIINLKEIIIHKESNNNNDNNNNNDINDIEDYLKNKTKISLGVDKNFLSSSINSSLMNEFEFNKPNSNKNKKKKFKNINNMISIKEKCENIEKEKEDVKNKINLNLTNILIPMTNMKKENNCFLNVLIQVLFHLKSFRINILKFFNNNSLNIEDEVVLEFCNLINSYNLERIKNEKNQNKIEPILSVNLLRKKLNQKFGNYFKGESGDPMESLERIFNSIHEEFTSENNLFKTKKKKNLGNCDCPIHQLFYLDLVEKQFCKNCSVCTKRHYDKNCYIFSIMVSEITQRIKESNQPFEKIHSKFFSKIKEQNENYEISIQRISGCKCEEINNIKKLNLLGVNNSYVIINLTWIDEFPDLKDILNVYTALPLSDINKHLFNVSEEKDQKLLYIKSMILYGIYHYICVIYLNKFKKWGIIDDKIIKYIDKYYDLVEYLLKNHLSPVGIIYSYEPCDKIDDMDKINNDLSKEKYLQILKFCKDVDNSKNIKMSYISKSKESLNEINENYLDNNLFRKSFLSQLINSSSSSNNEEVKEKENKDFELKKSSLNKKSLEEENEKNSEHDDNNLQKIDELLKAKGKNIKNSIFFFDE